MIREAVRLNLEDTLAHQKSVRWIFLFFRCIVFHLEAGKAENAPSRAISHATGGRMDRRETSSKAIL